MTHPMIRSRLATAVLLLAASLAVAAADSHQAAQEIEAALHLTPDIASGKKVYELCAVCHQPEGWGRKDGYYPQIAGQLSPVTIKQLADIRARDREAPTMLPFTMLGTLTLQQIADVAAYIEDLPMSAANGTGPGTDLAHGKQLYRDLCADCHGDHGEGYVKDFMPKIQGQHYQYLVRQFEWVRSGKRRNGDEEMRKQIQNFSDRDMAAVLDYVSRLSPSPALLASPDWVNPDFPKFVRVEGVGGE